MTEIDVPGMTRTACVSAGNAPLLTAEGLDIGYGSGSVLRDMDINIAPGEIVTIVGPNGSGKSTLLKALVGALTPSKGTVSRVEGLRIAYVPQRLSLHQAMPMTVRGFLQLAADCTDSELVLALKRVGAEGLERQQIAALSGGQLQRILLAQAVLRRADLLVLDEPTQSLDQPATAAFYALIEALRDELGCAVLMVSHDLHVVMRASDRVICINGHICCEGTPTVVSEAPEYQALFGLGTGGSFALYRHQHNHSHDGPCDHGAPTDQAVINPPRDEATH